MTDNIKSLIISIQRSLNIKKNYVTPKDLNNNKNQNRSEGIEGIDTESHNIITNLKLDDVYQKKNIGHVCKVK